MYVRRTLVIAAAVLTLSAPASAGWIPNGITVCNLTGDQRYPAVVPDGNGGANVSWIDFRSGSIWQLYAQHVDAFGTPTSTKHGVLISSANVQDISLPQSTISDGSTGVFMAWAEAATLGNWRVHAQWFSNGAPMWGGAGGVAVCTTAASQLSPTIAPDGSGGVIVVWQDYRSGSQFDLYAQRITAAGTLMWASGGAAVCTRSNNQTQQRLTSDGAGGAIIAWKDERAPLLYPDIYAQRVLGATGAPAWSVNGIPICTAALPQFNPEVVTDDAGGAIIGWQDERIDGSSTNSYYYDVYAQRVTGAGSVLWATDGVPFAPSTRRYQFPIDTPLHMVADGEGGAIACWYDDIGSTASAIRASKLDADGNRVWGIGAELVAPYISGVTAPYDEALRADGAGGAVFTWRDPLLGGGYGGVRGQRLDRNGLRIWNPDGVDIFWSGTVLDASPGLDPNALFVATAEYREGAVGGYGDVFLQRVELVHGVTGRPEPLLNLAQDVPGDQGGFVALNWWASDQDTPSNRIINHYSIWRSVTSGIPPTELVDVRDVKAGATGPIFARPDKTSEFYWELVGTQTAVGNAGYSFAAPTRADDQPGQSNGHFFRILAHDSEDVVYASGVAYASSIDNLAPAAPVFLAGQRIGNDVLLKWKRAPEKAKDLKQYALYRGTSSGVLPEPINLVSSPLDTVYTDHNAPAGTLYYIVTAFDVHQNQSAPSNVASVSGATGVSGDTPPVALSLMANVPNPFSYSTELRIGMPAAGNVTLEVFDVAGRRVASRTYENLGRGWQRMVFEARGSSGAALPTGVYFYKVRAAGETRTRKMVIAR